MAAKRNRLIAIGTRTLAGLVLLAIAVGIFALLVRTRPLPQEVGGDEMAPGVLVIKAKPVPVQRQWNGFGTARAMDSADVPARISATVVEIPEGIDPGQPVTRGQVIARLDESDFARQVEITTQNIADLDSQLERLLVEERSWEERTKLATEQVALARAEFDRVMDAMRREAARQREVDIARQSLIEAVKAEISAREEFEKLDPRRGSLRAQKLGQEAALRLATQNLQRCTIASPLDGVLQSVDVEVGENLQPGQRVARVVNLQRIEVPLLLPAGARATVRVGDEAMLRETSRDDVSWSGRVSRIAPEDDETTRTVAVYVELIQDPDEPRRLAPGRFVRGIIMSGSSPTRWVAPRRSVQSGRVLLIEDGRVTSRPITVDYHTEGSFPQLGLSDRQWVVLHEPLPEGALVVVNPSRTLQVGGAARPVMAEMAGSPDQGGRVGP